MENQEKRMKNKILGLIILLGAFSSSAFAQRYEFECEFEYETYTSDERYMDLELRGQLAENGFVLFSKERTRLHSYFFPAVGPAIWHMDSKMKLEAELDSENILTYRLEFYNYLRERIDLVKVYDETRRIDLSQKLAGDNKAKFDYIDGEVISSNINRDSWIEELSYVPQECKLKIRD